MSSKTQKDYQKIAEYLEEIISLMPGHVYWKDKNGVLQGCNNEQANSLGLSSREEIIGLTAYDSLPKDFADVITRIDKEVIETGIGKTAEEILTLPNGEKSVWLSKKVPLFDNDDKVSGLLGISFDITEQKRLEKELSETQHKLDGMTIVSASIAHELRTPLASLNISAEAIKNILPALIETYEQALLSGLDTPKINKRTLDALKDAPQIMLRETQTANAFINMLLTNLNPNIEDSSLLFSIKESIWEALDRYPFKPNQRSLVQFHSDIDFQVKGKQTLVVHILFNLIKNALFYIRQDGSNAIKIDIEPGVPYNKLIFMDTGSGIAPDILPFIFDRFFSRTHNGSGIGLTYCKTVMEALGGNITCESSLGHYTRFILNFPPT